LFLIPTKSSAFPRTYDRLISDSAKVRVRDVTAALDALEKRDDIIVIRVYILGASASITTTVRKPIIFGPVFATVITGNKMIDLRSAILVSAEKTPIHRLLTNRTNSAVSVVDLS
jgi:hypothetical protein